MCFRSSKKSKLANMKIEFNEEELRGFLEQDILAQEALAEEAFDLATTFGASH